MKTKLMKHKLRKSIKSLPVNKKKNRRAKRKRTKDCPKSLRFLGVNAAGLKSKMLTFKKVIEELKPSVFFIEETKYKDGNLFKLENYVIYELNRKSRDGGGGLALGVAEELQPAWVRDGDDKVEALSVMSSAKDLNIRCCVAYGCQESENVDKKDEFWKYLDEEVFQADMDGTGFILQFDGNLWAGCDIIPGDPRPQNRNGKLFQEFLDRHPQLSVVNGLQICEGLITRCRICDGKLEQSVLDFIVVCHRVLPYISRMVIDESKQYVLTNYKPVKNSSKAVDSDHNTMYMDLNLEGIHEKAERVEIFNFKEEKACETFKALTSETEEFTKCFSDELSLEKQINNWEQVLKNFCGKSFKKIRIRRKKLKPIKPRVRKLIDERNRLVRLRKCSENEQKIKIISSEIADFEAEEVYNKIVNQFKDIGDNSEQINLQQMWKLFNRMWPKHTGSKPVAKRNLKGKIVTSHKYIKTLLAREYKDRLRGRPTRPDLKSMKIRKDKIFQLKMKLAKMKKTPDWTMDQLESALA